jgi:Raf kinase inhibitor-like YbhB/YbcL family protein
VSERVEPVSEQQRPGSILVEGPALRDGAPIARDYTADGRDRSPALAWHHVPPAAKELIVVMEDLDETSPLTAGRPLVHWVLYRISPTVTRVRAGLPVQELVVLPPDTAGAYQAYTMYDAPGYRGPQPPPGPSHHYRFNVFAVDRRLGLKQGAGVNTVVAAMQGHVVGRGSITVTYQRKR